MPKFWLPMKYTIKEPTSGREQVIIIPGAEHMDRAQLNEIIAWQEETTMEKLRALGPKPEPRFSRKEVGKALKEFREHLERERKGTGNPRYY